MNKTVKVAFLLLGLLVVIFLIWQIVFNDGGIIKTGYNAVATGINTQWQKTAGGGSRILPLWDQTDAAGDANGQGFDIDTEG